MTEEELAALLDDVARTKAAMMDRLDGLNLDLSTTKIRLETLKTQITELRDNLT